MLTAIADHVAPFTTCRESAFLLRAAKWCSESNDLRLRTTPDAREAELERKHAAERAAEDAYSGSASVFSFGGFSIDSDCHWLDRRNLIQAEHERELELEAWLRRRSTEELF